jgi:hypothetical protein
MAEIGSWTLSGGGNETETSQILYLNLGATPTMQGPLVVYRIHNDGPAPIEVGPGATVVSINPGCDADVSGTEIQIAFTFGRHAAHGKFTASGTYELICCQPAPVA